MFKVFGILIGIIGVLVGVYVGFVEMFIGGIIQIIDALKAQEIDAAVIAWGAGKVIAASFVGGAIAWLGISIGIILGAFDNPNKSRKKF